MKKQNSKKYTDNEFIEAIKNSNSKCAALKKLGLQPYGGNYNSLENNLKRLNVDTSHFRKGEIWNKGKTAGPKRPIEDYLSNQFPMSSSDLRKRLVKEGLKELKCEGEDCGLIEWKNKPLRLELDHIDGNHFNNNLSNLRILCPNCHSQTPGHRKPKTITPAVQKYCACGKKITKEAIDCPACVGKRLQQNTKIKWPSKEELENLVWEQPRTKLSALLGVSDTIIAKHCRRLGIAMPPKGYWQKQYAKLK